MSNKTKYNNHYNGKQQEEIKQEEQVIHDHSVVSPEDLTIKTEEQVIENISVESTGSNTVETTTILGTNINEQSVENTAGLVQNTNDVKDEIKESVNVPTVRVNTKALNIRKEPSKDSDIVTIVYEDDLLMLQESTSIDGFYKVKTYTGFEGYCMEQFVNLN